MRTKDYNKIETQNDIRLNVFGYEKTFFPIYVSKESHEKELDPLLMEEEENQHYVLIIDSCLV